MLDCPGCPYRRKIIDLGSSISLGGGGGNCGFKIVKHLVSFCHIAPLLGVFEINWQTHESPTVLKDAADISAVN